jgi:hypothetical protein
MGVDVGKTETSVKRDTLLRLATYDSAEDVLSCFQDAFSDRQEFSSLMILAVVDCDDDTQVIRVYSTTMGHLEKLGLAEKAKNAID